MRIVPVRSNAIAHLRHRVLRFSALSGAHGERSLQLRDRYRYLHCREPVIRDALFTGIPVISPGWKIQYSRNTNTGLHAMLEMPRRSFTIFVLCRNGHERKFTPEP